MSFLIIRYFARSGNGVLINDRETPPSAVEAAECPTIKALVGMASTDVQALVTHNWGLDVSAPGYYDPQISFVQFGDNTFAPSLTFDWSNTNVVMVNKMAGSFSIQIIVTLRRGNGPWG